MLPHMDTGVSTLPNTHAEMSGGWGEGQKRGEDAIQTSIFCRESQKFGNYCCRESGVEPRSLHITVLSANSSEIQWTKMCLVLCLVSS